MSREFRLPNRIQNLHLERTAALDVMMREVEFKIAGEPVNSPKGIRLTRQLNRLWKVTVEACHDETSGRDLLGC